MSVGYYTLSDSSSRIAASRVRRRNDVVHTGHEVLCACADCGDLTYVDAAVFNACLRGLCDHCMRAVARKVRGL